MRKKIINTKQNDSYEIEIFEIMWARKKKKNNWNQIAILRTIFLSTKEWIALNWIFSVNTWKHLSVKIKLLMWEILETTSLCQQIYLYPWCNGYRLRKWTRRHEFKSWTRLVAFHIALIPLGKVWIQLFSLQPWVNSTADWVLQPWSRRRKILNSSLLNSA